MFRESFETAVFLEALSIDAPSAVVWGSLTGTALLLGLVFAVSRLGLRLPMTTLFKVSTVVLVATAVVLLGQGHPLARGGGAAALASDAVLPRRLPGHLSGPAQRARAARASRPLPLVWKAVEPSVARRRGAASTPAPKPGE